MKLEYYKWYKGENILPEQMEDFCSNNSDSAYVELVPYFLVIQDSEPATAIRISDNGGQSWVWEYCFGGPKILVAQIKDAPGIESTDKDSKKTLYWMAIREPNKEKADE